MSNRNINKIILVGDLGSDPELRHTQKGQSVVNLSIATNREFKSGDGTEKKETHWHRAVVWGKRAELCAKFLTKGSRVYVEGELLWKEWTDQEGQTRRTAEVLVEEIKFLGGLRPKEQPVAALA
jgi:single-strand DNA-binding protein